MRTGRNKSLNSVFDRWLSDTQAAATLLRCDWRLTAAGTPCRPPTPPSSVTGGWNHAALCQGWPNPSGSYTAPPGRRWNPEAEVRGQTEAKRPVLRPPPESRAHLELVFDDLSLFVLQLQEEELVLLQTSKEDSALKTWNVLPRTGSWRSGETTITFQRSWTRFWPLRRVGRRACSSPTGVLWLCTSCNKRSKSEVRGQPAGQRSAKWFEALKKRSTCFYMRWSAARSALCTNSQLSSASLSPAGSAQTWRC